MATSRRGFLRGGAAAVTLLSGGAGNAAKGGAALASGAALLSDTWSSVDQTLRDLSVDPVGFPIKAMQNIMGIVGPKADKFRTHLNGQMSPVNPGEEIQLYGDNVLMDALDHFPKDIPILSFLSNSLLEEKFPEDDGRYYGLGGSHKKTAQQFREFIEPLCDENTTAADLKRGYFGYYEDLARYALKNPDAFQIQFSTVDFGKNPHAEGSVMNSGLKTIMRVLRSNPDHTEEVDSLLVDLGRVESKWVKRRFDEALEKARKDASEAAQRELERIDRYKQECAQEKHERETQPSVRERFVVALQPKAQGEYHIVGGGYDVLPSRVDWLHMAQEIDPDNIKPSDIQLNDDGTTLYVASALVRDFIEANTKSEGASPMRSRKIARMSLPNQRMGIDLNDGP